MIQISEESARIIARVLEDILDIQNRASCSDRYFRQHFINLVTAPPVKDARTELDKAIEENGTK